MIWICTRGADASRVQMFFGRMVLIFGGVPERRVIKLRIYLILLIFRGVRLRHTWDRSALTGRNLTKSVQNLTEDKDYVQNTTKTARYIN